MAKTTDILKGVSVPGKYPFYFNGQTVKKSSVDDNKGVKVSGRSGEGGTVQVLSFEEEETQPDGTVTVGKMNYYVSLVTSRTFVTKVGSYTVPVASTIDLLFVWEPYIETPPAATGADGSIPSSLPAAPLTTPEEWEEYRTASGGFNIPYLDEYHIETLGNFPTKSDAPFQSPHIKDRTAAEKIAKKLTFDSQLELDVDVPCSPYFVAELGDFAQLIDPYNNINSIERLHNIRWDEKNQEVTFSFKAREVE